MWPVAANTNTVAPVADSSPSEFLSKDRCKICVGDCALFKPPSDSPPFIGLIRKLTFNKEKSLRLEVNWLYRPADLKHAKGTLVEAAPNEVFYSFHKDEAPAASLLHPCKVAFLHNGFELPSGISAFVCRQERQEEVDQLLDKTKLEMHDAVQSGGRSPKPLNGPASPPLLKSGSDSIQNSSFGAQGKGKKRERGDQISDSFKREWLIKAEDGVSGQSRPDSLLKSEIAKITDEGGLVDFQGVEKLVQLMQPDNADKKIDLAGRIMLVDVIAVTDRYDCLGWFVQLRGLPVLDEWLQEVHKGKIGVGNIPKESDKSVEEFLLGLLRALDKLPVNLHALQTCNVGKSVNHLRTHKNSEIQKKARGLVDTWKKRVEAEMNMTDSKSGSSRSVSWPAKPASSEVSHVGNRKIVGSSENIGKSSAIQTSASKSSQPKLSSGEALSKPSSSPGSTKSTTTSVGNNSKDSNTKLLVGAGTSDPLLNHVKEERSSGSSQSQNNSLSCSSEHAKTIGSCREDARSSTAVSMSMSKLDGSTSCSRKSNNGLHGVTVVQKDLSSGKILTRNSPCEKVSPTLVPHEKLPDAPLLDHGNTQQLILRLPNAVCSPARGVSGGSFEESNPSSKASPPADKNDNQDRRVKAKIDSLQTTVASNMLTNACDTNEALSGYEDGKSFSMGDERCKASEDCDKVAETSKPSSSSAFVSRSGQTYDASLSPMNALVESCVKFSEASVSVSPGDDGMNLLATVAAGEISRSENCSPLVSPARKSPAADELSSGNDCKSKHSGEGVGHGFAQYDGGITREDNLNTVDLLQFRNDFSGDGEASSSSCVEKTADGTIQMHVSTTGLVPNSEGPCLWPEINDNASATILPAKKENHPEPGGLDTFHEQRKLNSKTSPFDEDQKVDRLDEGITENEKLSVSKGEFTAEMIEREAGEKSPELSSDVGNENQISAEVTSTSISVPKSSPAEDFESSEVKNEDLLLYSASCKASRAGNANDNLKPGVIEPIDKRMDPDSAVSPGAKECAEENLGSKEVLSHHTGSSGLSELPTAGHTNEVSKTYGDESEGAGEQHAYSVNASPNAAGSESMVKLDFDLNEGFPIDDVGQGEIVKQEEPILSSVHIPCPLPFPISSVSGNFHASITVASAAKGSVLLPENSLQSKGELQWKGSAATSAFRPAEPRKNVEPSSNTGDIPSVDASTIKQGRPPLDFDLNVPDERSFEGVDSHGSLGQTRLESGPHDRSAVGLDLDLNRVDDTPEAGSFSMTKLDIPSLPSKPSLTAGLSNGGTVSRDFDLNNGPGLDEVGSDVPSRSQQMKSIVPFPSVVHGVRTNSVEFGNYSSWFPPGNSYSAISVPPLLSGRGEQSFVAGAGAQRILGPTSSTPFGPEIYAGPVFSSSPSVAYSPSPPFLYPGFPFETNFPLSSNSFSGCSTSSMDSSTVGGLCFPMMTSQPAVPGGVVSSTYPRPYVTSLPGGTSCVIPDSRKWASLDLNSGPGGTDTERRDDRLPSGLRPLSVPNSQALMDGQMMYQVAGVLKRKEPDGGWDGPDRFSYKQPSWQ